MEGAIPFQNPRGWLLPTRQTFGARFLEKDSKDSKDSKGSKDDASDKDDADNGYDADCDNNIDTKSDVDDTDNTDNEDSKDNHDVNYLQEALEFYKEDLGLNTMIHPWLQHRNSIWGYAGTLQCRNRLGRADEADKKFLNKYIVLLDEADRGINLPGNPL